MSLSAPLSAVLAIGMHVIRVIPWIAQLRYVFYTSVVYVNIDHHAFECEMNLWNAKGEHGKKE